jgi:hypothetical protein
MRLPFAVLSMVALACVGPTAPIAGPFGAVVRWERLDAAADAGVVAIAFLPDTAAQAELLLGPGVVWSYSASEPPTRAVVSSIGVGDTLRIWFKNYSPDTAIPQHSATRIEVLRR